MGMDSRNDDLPLPPLAKQKFQELVALLAEAGFGPDGPSQDTDFATIERFGHRAGQMLGRAIDEHLTAQHAEHFQEGSCPTCGAVTCGAVTCGAVTCGAVTCGAVTCGAVTCGAVTCEAVTCEAAGESDAVEKTKTRPLQTQDGTILLGEPVFRCPKCNRNFFPSADSVAD